jgi:protein-tyrosine phosphatase
MSHYPITWITEKLAVGHAPMSYAELDSIKDQGISAIVNLCGEFCDLHEIEENAGFEVFYLPIPDETAPSMEEMEKGLEWLDEAVYLGKKVLIHCKHGIGRTGTFLTAYMLRRGFKLKKAEKLLKKTKTRANPSNYSQWWLLRKFGKKEGYLKSGEATPENRKSDNLGEYYERYEQLLQKVDSLVAKARTAGKQNDTCGGNFSLQPIEALYLNNNINIGLSAQQRNRVIEDAGARRSGDGAGPASPATQLCPLNQNNRCLLHQHRPVHCRIQGATLGDEQLAEINRELEQLSSDILHKIFGQDLMSQPPAAKLTEVLSGKFIQKYFQHLASQKSAR